MLHAAPPLLDGGGPGLVGELGRRRGGSLRVLQEPQEVLRARRLARAQGVQAHAQRMRDLLGSLLRNKRRWAWL